MNPLALHQLYERGNTEQHLELLLRRLVNAQSRFSRFADCGAGIGHVAKSYANILRDSASPALTCYEPLPENAACLRERMKDVSFCRVHQAAVAEKDGLSRFHVPIRMKGNGSWSEGTSWGGFLHETKEGEAIDVRTVRMEDHAPFDFIKLDLQGGEKNALLGLGKFFATTPLLYVENQLLENDGCRALLREHFHVFLDRLQFGFKTQDISVRILDEVGIHITRIWTPDSLGMPLMIWGHFRDRSEFDADNLSLSTEAIGKLRKSGMSYLATDLLCVNRARGDIIPMLFHGKHS